MFFFLISETVYQYDCTLCPNVKLRYRYYHSLQTHSLKDFAYLLRYKFH